MPEIIINQGGKQYRLKWELIHQDHRCERYRVAKAENPAKAILIENNRPLIRGKYKLKHRPIDWKQVSGPGVRAKVVELIAEKIERGTVIDKPMEIPQRMATNRKKKDSSGPTLEDRNK